MNVLDYIPNLPDYLWALGVFALALWALAHDKVWKD